MWFFSLALLFKTKYFLKESSAFPARFALLSPINHWVLDHAPQPWGNLLQQADCVTWPTAHCRQCLNLSHPLKSSWFLFGDDCDPQGTLAMSAVTFGEEGCGRPLVCESQGYFYTSCNAQVDPSTTRNYPAPNGNSTESEKPCSKQIVILHLFVWVFA